MNIICKIIFILIGFCIGYIYKEIKSEKNTVPIESVKNEVNNNLKERTNKSFEKRQESFEEKKNDLKIIRKGMLENGVWGIVIQKE
ncbi:hypothetical protein [Clostridium perfringens]|nr:MULTISPECIES: hypothetical protein [Clostridium]MDK7628488.1 hypothetical protein [Clostridium sp. UMB9555A]